MANHGDPVIEWLKQPRKSVSRELRRSTADRSPDVLTLVMAWCITFTIVLILTLTVGFGLIGIGAGMLISFYAKLIPRANADSNGGTTAETFRLSTHAGFTRAGGMLPSRAMLGTLLPGFVSLAAVGASFMTVLVWICGVGQ